MPTSITNRNALPNLSLEILYLAKNQQVSNYAIRIIIFITHLKKAF